MKELESERHRLVVATTTTKESTSTGGADTLGEPKESSESVSMIVHVNLVMETVLVKG